VIAQRKSNDIANELKKLHLEIESLRREQKDVVKRAYDLEKRNLRLAELNQAKDEFIAIASHQLRTPATGVKQYIALLIDGYSGPLKQSQKLFLQKAYESNERQLRIIDDLLQVARIDSDSFKIVAIKTDITKLVTDTVNELKKDADNHKITLVLNKPKRSIKARVDVPRFRMVIENLLENAMHYSLPDTTVTTVLEEREDYIMITIQDEGVGISPKDIPKLFQKFSRIPNPLSLEVGGSGLGLYWADRMVKFHGGLIEVTSKLGSGSAFIIKIPLYQ